MLSLLLNNSIFLLIENDFYTQLTGSRSRRWFWQLGTSLADVPPLPLSTYGKPDTTTEKANASTKPSRKRKPKAQKSQPTKRRKCNNSEDPDAPKTPNAIIFARSRIFYSRPSKSVRGHVIYGLRIERASRSPEHDLTFRCFKSLSRSYKSPASKAHYEIYLPTRISSS